MKNKIIAFCTDGLCNRIKCILTALRFADQESKSFVLCWPKDHTLNCGFSDLFSNNFDEIDIDEFNYQRAKTNFFDTNKVIHTWRLLPFPEDNLPNKFSKAPFSKSGGYIDLEYNRIPNNIRKNYLYYLRKLSITQYVADSVAKFHADHMQQCNIGINIRTWEELDCGRNRYFRPSSVYNILDNIAKLNVFVSTDSEDFLQQLNNRYPGNILYYPKRTFLGDRNSVEGIQDAFIDLLLASKNSFLKLSFISTFSEMIWWFGECKSQVEMIPLKTHPLLITSEGFCLLWKWYWMKKL